MLHPYTSLIGNICSARRMQSFYRILQVSHPKPLKAMVSCLVHVEFFFCMLVHVGLLLDVTICYKID
jgi:hypothetical protein